MARSQKHRVGPFAKRLAARAFNKRFLPCKNIQPVLIAQLQNRVSIRQFYQQVNVEFYRQPRYRIDIPSS
jgi:hypothetical protein